MTQLILDVDGLGVALPESRKGGYQASLDPLSVDVQMISGRMVRELRGSVWNISYQYGYFNESMKDLVIKACEKGKKQPILCSFLVQDGSGTMKQSKFFVTSFTRPKFMWSTQLIGGGETAVALWADYPLGLREVKPSD
ncbi:MAG: hypothetical protein HFF19_01100 [Oscillospiraceae bacterium]|jgi:hypothetical protein|nr:hypothetical protein [Oscillospiraceae bacterium]